MRKISIMLCILCLVGCAQRPKDVAQALADSRNEGNIDDYEVTHKYEHDIENQDVALGFFVVNTNGTDEIVLYNATYYGYMSKEYTELVFVDDESEIYSYLDHTIDEKNSRNYQVVSVSKSGTTYYNGITVGKVDTIKYKGNPMDFKEIEITYNKESVIITT